MENERIKDWIKVFESPDFLEADLIEARLKDQNIEFYSVNKSDIGYTVEIGKYWSYNAGLPVKIFVHMKDQLKALDLINEDRSNLLDDENLDFGKTEDELDSEKEKKLL